MSVCLLRGQIEDDLSTVLLVLRAEVIADGCFPAIEHKASLFCMLFSFL